MGTALPGGIPTPSGMVGSVFQALKTYDASLVQVIIGVFPIIGYATNSVVSIERNEPTYRLEVGAWGEVTRIMTNNLTGRVTVKLMQTSESNILLTTLQYMDEIGTFGIYPIVIMDLGGLSTYLSASAWIRQPAAGEFAKNAGERTWIFDLATCDILNLGNLSVA